MNDISNRIKAIIEHTGLTKTEFSKRINVSQAFVSQMCTGAAKPSDRTIRDICEKFSINETWLRTSEGEMLKPISRDEEIAAFMGDVMRGEDADFRRRLISVLARLDVEEWELLGKVALKLAEESKKEDQAEA